MSLALALVIVHTQCTGRWILVMAEHWKCFKASTGLDFQNLNPFSFKPNNSRSNSETRVGRMNVPENLVERYLPWCLFGTAWGRPIRARTRPTGRRRRRGGGDLHDRNAWTITKSHKRDQWELWLRLSQRKVSGYSWFTVRDPADNLTCLSRMFLFASRKRGNNFESLVHLSGCEKVDLMQGHCIANQFTCTFPEFSWILSPGREATGSYSSRAVFSRWDASWQKEESGRTGEWKTILLCDLHLQVFLLFNDKHHIRSIWH